MLDQGRDIHDQVQTISDTLKLISTELLSLNLARAIARKRMADVYAGLPWWRRLVCTPEKLAQTARMMDVAADVYLEDLDIRGYLDRTARSAQILKGGRR